MRIEVDRDLCEGHAQCCALAPEVFQLDGDFAMHLVADTVADEHRAAVESAVATCPRQALRLVPEAEG